MNIEKQKNMVIGGSIILSLILLCYYFFFYNSKSNAVPTIAIIKTATHPALDQALVGFYEEIKNKFHDDIAFIIKNADSSVTAAQTIVDSLQQNKNIMLFYSIATLALSAIAQKEQQRPIVFSAVTNPSILGLENQKNICGVTDLVDIKKQINHILTFVPNAKSVGIIFNGGEVNSLYVVRKMQKELEKRKIVLRKISVMSPVEIPAALEQIINTIDVLIAPADNTVATAASLITTISNTHKVPSVFADNLLLQYGATATCGVDYEKAGSTAGKIAISLIENINTPETIGFMQAEETKLMINKILYEMMKEKLYFDPTTMQFNE